MSRKLKYLSLGAALGLLASTVLAVTLPIFDNFTSQTNGAVGTSLVTYNSHWVISGAGAAALEAAPGLTGAMGVSWNSATLGDAFRNDVTWSASQQVYATVLSIGGTDQTGLSCEDTAGSNGYVLQINSAVLQLSKNVAGTVTPLANDNAHPLTAGQVVQLTCTVAGATTTLKVFVNGVQNAIIGTVTDGTFITGSPGIFGTGTAHNNTLTNFFADNVPNTTPAANGTLTVVANQAIPLNARVLVGTIAGPTQAVGFNLTNLVSQNNNARGWAHVLIPSGYAPGATFVLQATADGGKSWVSLSGATDSLGPLLPGASPAVYSARYDISGHVGDLFQFGLASGSVVQPLVVYILLN